MKISENVYVIASSKGSYVYLITGKEKVLIDTGLKFKEKGIIKELKAMGIKLEDIKHILLTHHDLDHVGNLVKLQELTGATIWASEKDIPYITGAAPRYGFKKYMARILSVKKPQNIDPYVDGQSIADIKVIPTPGHTPGHVCLMYKDILFAGDLIENKKGVLRPYPKFWNWDNDMMLHTIKKLSGIKFRWLCPAHGAPIQSNGKLVD